MDDKVETEGEVDEDQKRHPLVRLGEMAIAGKANTRSTTLRSLRSRTPQATPRAPAR
jgi:hypothetical protein